MKLDAVDIAILAAMQENARITISDLADRLHVVASTCQRRLTRLEENGVIQQYTALLNEDALGYEAGVVVQIALDSQSETALNAFECAVVEIPEVVECHLMAGESDYLVRLVVRDMRDFERIHKAHLSRLPHVTRIQSNMALRRIVRKSPPLPNAVE
ncbi:MAG: AsnC family transcriptional regulator [Rhodospirillaceae bacterium]|nr:AsnC family transcriptional regulator [Rhodospirillales bacterium]MAX48109.1 AsnC family transcriptional regulator [Rhodospirillaceae bacterium]